MKNPVKELGYFFLNLLTGNKGIQRTINGVNVRFPARWSKYYQKDYEAENFKFLREKIQPGMEVIDIGSHIGLFAIISSKLLGNTGQIVGFEPTPGTFKIFQETVKLNHCTNIITIQGAVSKIEGSATFYVSETAGCNSNSLVRIKPESETRGYPVTLYSIDGVVQKLNLKPKLIKIDAEGTELDVLKGAEKTLNDFKPALIIGIHPPFLNKKGDSLDSIWEMLGKFQYRINEAGMTLAKAEFCSRKFLFDIHCS